LTFFRARCDGSRLSGKGQYSRHRGRDFGRRWSEFDVKRFLHCDAGEFGGVEDVEGFGRIDLGALLGSNINAGLKPGAYIRATAVSRGEQ
jgi:hypothetical protein